MDDIRRAAPKSKVLNRDRARFEVAAGNYRLIAAFDFRRQIVFVKSIGTHAEYDAIDALMRTTSASVYAFQGAPLCLLRPSANLTQVRAMQKSAPLTAILLPTLDRQSGRHQADSSCQVCAYAFPQTPSRPQRPEPAPRPHLRLSFRSAEDLVG